jgi:GTPase
LYVSAVDGTGLGLLRKRIDDTIAEDPVSRVRLCIPQKEGKMLALLEARAKIFSRKYKAGTVELEVGAPASVLRRVREWAVRDSETVVIE